MARFIDADEFVKRVIQYPRQSTKTIGLALADTPTADAVPVVRCKDCKWFDMSDIAGTIEPICYRCKRFARTYRYAEDFCSYGERKETEDE